MKEFYNTAQRFSIRKYSIGAASVLLGAVFLAQGQVASADQVTDSAETPQAEMTIPAPAETVKEATASSVVEVVEKPLVSTVETPETETSQAEAIPAKTAETPVAEIPETASAETPTKATQGYAAATTDRPTSSVSTDTTRRRAPKNTRKAPEAFQNTARGFAKAEVNPNTPEVVVERETFTIINTSTDDTNESQGQTGFFHVGTSSVARGDDYPNRFKYSSTGIDDWRLFVKQCTSFTAYRLSSANGFELPPAYGNAGQWGYRAQREGYRVDKNPAIGSVAWWDDGGYGHVAWVSNILGSNVEIEEYNYNWSGSYNKRTVTIGSVSGFIHFKDLVGGQPQATAHTTNSSNQGVAQSGTYTFTKRAGIRAATNMSSPELAYYEAGQSVNYDRKVTENGYEWISYLSFAGNRRYIAIKETAPAVAQPTTGTIQIQNNNNQAGTFDIIISNVHHSKGIQAVIVPTWSDKDGQDDIKWYEASRQADGTYKQTVRASDHKNSTGLYHAHLYYRQHDGQLVGAGGTTTTVSLQTPQRQQPTIPSSGTYRFTARSAVRPEARMASAELAHYNPGMTVYYDRVLQSEGRTWISYIAGSGNRRYIAIN